MACAKVGQIYKLKLQYLPTNTIIDVVLECPDRAPGLKIYRINFEFYYSQVLGKLAARVVELEENKLRQGRTIWHLGAVNRQLQALTKTLASQLHRQGRGRGVIR